MLADALLARILQLANGLDAAIEAGRSVPEDDVYTLAGLVLELDRWLCEGRRIPDRWTPKDRPLAPLVLAGGPANNETAPPRRSPLARRRHARSPGQLAFPFDAVAP